VSVGGTFHKVLSRMALGGVQKQGKESIYHIILQDAKG
jgi:hypothetical protein